MKQTLILLLFFWDNVEFTLTHEECSQLPSVERSFVLDEYKKAAYQKGDVIYFSCDRGYTTGLNTTYVCTEQGWRAATIGQCIEEGTFSVRLGCTRPPALTNGYVLKNSTYAYGDGQRARYQCDNLYTLTGGSFKTCTNGQWTGDVQCQEVTCELPAPNSAKVRVPVGNRITVQCVTEGSSQQVECLPSGQWNSTFSTCSETCDVVLIPDSVLVSPRDVRQLRRGESLQFRCKVGSHVLHGANRVTCLENGEWSHPFPSCADPLSCGPPPPLDNGDFFATSTQFGHYTRVEYQCQHMYLMQGTPYKTCLNGVWTGEMKCLKPCTIDAAQLQPNQITFRFSMSNKLYVSHGDHMTFVCAQGRHDGKAAMRQRCNDGELVLPRCV